VRAAGDPAPGAIYNDAAMKTLLLDLDDTLLGNPMETFVPAYFDALSRWAAPRVAPDKLIAELLRSTRVMAANDGSRGTNEEVFASEFYPALGRDRAELEHFFARFYAERFPDLQGLTSRRPEARDLVDWAIARGLEVVIATNPLFPAAAIEERLRWAGLPVAELDFALVTTYENMHASKASPLYYREILEVVGSRPEECLMVGDHWEWDVLQPARAGIPAYWIADAGAARPDAEAEPVGQGTLAQLVPWIRRRAG